MSRSIVVFGVASAIAAVAVAFALNLKEKNSRPSNDKNDSLEDTELPETNCADPRDLLLKDDDGSSEPLVNSTTANDAIVSSPCLEQSISENVNEIIEEVEAASSANTEPAASSAAHAASSLGESAVMVCTEELPTLGDSFIEVIKPISPAESSIISPATESFPTIENVASTDSAEPTNRESDDEVVNKTRSPKRKRHRKKNKASPNPAGPAASGSLNGNALDTGVGSSGSSDVRAVGVDNNHLDGNIAILKARTKKPHYHRGGLNPKSPAAVAAVKEIQKSTEKDASKKKSSPKKQLQSH